MSRKECNILKVMGARLRNPVRVMDKKTHSLRRVFGPRSALFENDASRANAAYIEFEARLNAENDGNHRSFLDSPAESPALAFMLEDVNVEASHAGASYRGNTNGNDDDDNTIMTMFLALEASRFAKAIHARLKSDMVRAKAAYFEEQQALLAASPMKRCYSQARCDRHSSEAVDDALGQHAAALLANAAQQSPGNVAGGAVARDQSGWD